jgi:hypothetical protein
MRNLPPRPFAPDWVQAVSRFIGRLLAAIPVADRPAAVPTSRYIDCVGPDEVMESTYPTRTISKTLDDNAESAPASPTLWLCPTLEGGPAAHASPPPPPHDSIR